MRNISLATRSLLVGTVFTMSLAAVVLTILPNTAHAQREAAPQGTTPTDAEDPLKANCMALGLCTGQVVNVGGVASENTHIITTAQNPTGGTTVEDRNGLTGMGQEIVTDKDGNIISQTKLGGWSGSSEGGCSVMSWTNIGDCVLNVVATFTLTFANFMLGIAGVLLNWVVVKTVFQFSTLVGNSAGLLTAWGILRDIGNLVLLFGFVLMGIGTILDTNKLPDKKAIPMLILFAVLLNFSIFAAEAVIDTSNVLTSVLYSQANTDPCTTETCTINNGIAGHIMQSTGLSSVYGLKPESVEGVTKKFVVLMGLSLFSLIGTVVLFAAALMLAFRAIVLTGLIILSPIGFAGMAIKPLEKMARRWWNALIHQAFFAPILFLLLFVTLKVTEGFSTTSNNGNLAQALTGVGTSNMGIIMVFVLISGGLIASLMAAKQFGAMGASLAVNTATKMAFGGYNTGMGLAGRFTRVAVQRSPIGDTAVGRGIASSARFVEHGGLDPRGMPLISKGLQVGLKRAGATDGTQPKDSLKISGDFIKKNTVDKSKEDRKKHDEERAVQRTKDNRGILANDIRNGALSTGSERFLAGLNGKSLEDIPAVRAGDPAIIRALSPDQFESLMKSDNLSGAEKGRIGTARFADLQTQIAAGDRAAVRQWTNKDLQQLAKSNATMFQQVVSATDAAGASYLSDDQQENLTKSDALTRTQRQNVRSYSVVGRIESNAGIPGSTAEAEAARLARNLNPKQKVKLGAAALTNGSATTGVMSTLTASDLGKIMEDGKLTDPQKSTIAAAVKDPSHPNFSSIEKYLTGNVMAQAYWI